MGVQAYSLSHQFTVLPTLSEFLNFEIFNTRRNMSLQSITWDVEIINLTNGNKINLTDRPEHILQLMIGVTTGDKISKTFSNIQNGLPLFNMVPNYNGSGFLFYNPGQYKFNSFYISEDLFASISFTNMNAWTAFQYVFSVIIEIKE